MEQISDPSPRIHKRGRSARRDAFKGLSGLLHERQGTALPWLIGSSVVAAVSTVAAGIGLGTALTVSGGLLVLGLAVAAMLQA